MLFISAASLTYQCTICKVRIRKKEVVFYKIDFLFQTQMGDPKTYKQHFESKHPKNELPADLKDI
jgi:hypothetical protein